MLTAIAHALMMAGIMAWEILWALILGFVLSAVIQAVVSKKEMSSLLPDDSPRTIVLACGLGGSEFFLLLCRRGAGTVHVSQGREFHCVDGFPVRIHESRAGTRHLACRADGLAIYFSRVHRRPVDDRHSGIAVQTLSFAKARRNCACTS